MFQEKDILQFRKRGVSIDQVMDQLSRFEKGFPSLNVVRAATINDGILKLGEQEVQRYVTLYEEKKKGLKLLKFVPASGAATRMFKDLYEALNSYSGEEQDFTAFLEQRKLHSVLNVINHITEFAFRDDLDMLFRKKGSSLNKMISEGRTREILQAMLISEGLNYGNLPKGLLPFHKVNGKGRTAFEEHLVEGSLYCRQTDSRVNIHFTVSPEHESGFRNLLDARKELYASLFDVRFHVHFSRQKLSTDTIAVDLNNKPFRLENGEILFRPGGHGALLENLNDIEADIIFIKNIDNVAPDRLKQDTVLYKKALAGLLTDLSSRINIYLGLLETESNPSSVLLSEMADFIEHDLSFILPASFRKMRATDQRNYLLSRMDRPLRVCGMVRNEGEPGGGPFWVANSDGSTGLQIAESTQFKMNDPHHARVFRSSTHFNPVDLVCRIIDHHGNRYRLHRFRDPETGFISTRSKDGRDVKALELPGLWNGAMAHWNTVFVEVPPTTFSPVKTITDLLRKEHQ